MDRCFFCGSGEDSGSELEDLKYCVGDMEDNEAVILPLIIINYY